jgi:hypothetical protein
MSVRICYITTIYGNYESSCKPFAPQTVPTDFICFTDNPNIVANGWIVDVTPYHITNPCPFDDGTMRNSIANNNHKFNVCKYYKANFQSVPRLKDYDVVVWLDGTIEILNPGTSEWVLNNIDEHKIIGWHQQSRHGKLHDEMWDSVFFYRYCSSYWNGQYQPYQPVEAQYADYVNDGYKDDYFKERNPQPENPHFGVWLTCFVAFLNKDDDVKKFLNLWYLQILKHTTQDQISFPYVCQKLNMIPLTLPNKEIKAEHTNILTDFYRKHEHALSHKMME